MVMMTTDATKVIQIEQIIADQRHTSGVVYPHCGYVEIESRNGHRKNAKQKFHCNNCDENCKH